MVAQHLTVPTRLHHVLGIQDKPPGLSVIPCHSVRVPGFHKAGILRCEQYSIDMWVVLTDDLTEFHVSVKVRTGCLALFIYECVLVFVCNERDITHLPDPISTRLSYFQPAPTPSYLTHPKTGINTEFPYTFI